MKYVWETAVGKYCGGLAQGDDKSKEKGSNTIFVMNRDEVRNNNTDKYVTYGRLVMDYRPQKDDPDRGRLTAGGNMTTDQGETRTKSVDLTTHSRYFGSVC